VIGYYFLKRSAGDAAKKAFVVNRVGDWGLATGVLLIFAKFGSLDFHTVGEAIKEGVAAGQYHMGDPISSASRWRSSSELPESLRRFLCMSGCRMLWKARLLSAH
jgi:NADH:ubiquinone oxidoreductase subunit 5 (subunit L)/multisubunit Na+/H+ antiporter MnhA subunit